MLHATVRFVALFAIGLAAGGALCILLLERYMPGSPSFYIEYKQMAIRALTVPLPALAAAGLLATAADCWLTGRQGVWPAFWLGIFAIVLNLAAAILTKAGHFPINDQIIKWSPGNPPPDWAATAARWSVLHAWRTALSLGSFASLILSQVLRLR